MQCCIVRARASELLILESIASSSSSMSAIFFLSICLLSSSKKMLLSWWLRKSNFRGLDIVLRSISRCFSVRFANPVSSCGLRLMIVEIAKVLALSLCLTHLLL